MLMLIVLVFIVAFLLVKLVLEINLWFEVNWVILIEVLLIVVLELVLMVNRFLLLLVVVWVVSFCREERLESVF